MTQLTSKEQYFRVTYLGILFMIMFTSFNSLQNMVSKLYEDYHYDYLGQTAIIFIYLSFGLGTFFTSYFIKTFGYKMVMFCSSLGYAIFEATGLFIVSDLNLSIKTIWIIVIIGAIICGISASAIWVAQGAYTSQVASNDKKSQLFGLFWGLMMSSQIFGNSLSTFVLGRVNNFTYFLLLTILGFLSAFLFLLLPNVKKSQQSIKKEKSSSLKQQLTKIKSIISNPKYKYLFFYFLFNGLIVAFYAGFLYKLIKLSIPQQKQTNQQYGKKLNQSVGFVFISLGASQLFTGLMMNNFAQKFSISKLAIVGTILVFIAGLTSFYSYFIRSYALCFICSFFWGSSENFLQTITNSMIAKIFPDSIQAYSVFRIFYAAGVSFIVFISIILGSLPQYVFLSLILLFQVVAIVISLNLSQLIKNQNIQKLKEGKKE